MTNNSRNDKNTMKNININLTGSKFIPQKNSCNSFLQNPKTGIFLWVSEAVLLLCATNSKYIGCFIYATQHNHFSRTSEFVKLFIFSCN